MKTVTPDQPQAVPDALTAIQRVQEWVRNSRAALLTTDPDFMPKHVTLKDVGAFLRQEAAALAARPVLPVEKPAEGMRTMIEGRLKHWRNRKRRQVPSTLAYGDGAIDAYERVLKHLASITTAPLSGKDGSLREALDECWDDLVNKDDRTSPEEYPDMALITREELGDYLDRAALAAVPPETAKMEKLRREIAEDELDRLYRKANADYIEAETRGDAIAQELHSAAAFWLNNEGGLSEDDRLAARASSSGEAGDE